MQVQIFVLCLTIKFKKGPSTVAVGFTQASVSASNNPLPEAIVTPKMESENEDPIDGSIIDKDNDILAPEVARVGDVGATKDDTALIIVMIAKHKNEVRKHIFVSIIGMRLYISYIPYCGVESRIG